MPPHVRRRGTRGRSNTPRHAAQARAGLSAGRSAPRTQSKFAAFDEFCKRLVMNNPRSPRPRKQYCPQVAKPKLVCRTPILLTHTPTRCRVIPVAGIKLGIGRRRCVASDAEQRTEGVERVEASVEPKREFVEVGL